MDTGELWKSLQKAIKDTSETKVESKGNYDNYDISDKLKTLRIHYGVTDPVGYVLKWQEDGYPMDDTQRIRTIKLIEYLLKTIRLGGNTAAAVRVMHETTGREDVLF